ncbi:hypothetical protein MCOR25_006307 [Pyricularia grisea]|uniref:CFEM domain-containing protein n=1 Tax=Pyricularia grisea TaxID=148305 RepID=A0A6P8BJA2_PYRGI|nr:uncharacterized protein PgNI_01997 [Pyricularia grisea]KAI6362072.1 hypothetical protein MCOR25_006307 [Pyricularia grisea]TLD16868.1 hypothetical protein PgNI_01997 [Pyricularia grisea]
MLLRRLQFQLLGLLVAATLGAATTVGNITTSDRIPKCALRCLVEELPASTCPSTSLDKHCICTNHDLRRAVYDCLTLKCSVRDNFAAINVTATACGVEPVSTVDISIEFYATFTTLTVIFISGRMATKIAGISTWWWDDTTIVIVFIIHMATSLSGLLWGMTGTEIWALSPAQINRFLFISFIYGIRYIINMALIKASILFGLLRVFPNKTFRRVLWGTQIFNLLFSLAMLGAWLGQCQPVSFYWLGWDGEHEGSCVDRKAVVLTHAGIHLSLDVWILILPINQVAALNLERKKKVGAVLMFGVGIFLTIACALRLNALVEGVQSRNISTRGFWTAVWSNIENSVGIMVACMPAMRILFTQLIIPKFRDSMGERRDSTAPSIAHSKTGTMSTCITSSNTNSHHSRGRSLQQAVNSRGIGLIDERDDGRQRDLELGEMEDLGLRVQGKKETPSTVVSHERQLSE